jgi:hypothetical protein
MALTPTHEKHPWLSTASSLFVDWYLHEPFGGNYRHKLLFFIYIMCHSLPDLDFGLCFELYACSHFFAPKGLDVCLDN